MIDNDFNHCNLSILVSTMAFLANNQYVNCVAIYQIFMDSYSVCFGFCSIPTIAKNNKNNEKQMK